MVKIKKQSKFKKYVLLVLLLLLLVIASGLYLWQKKNNDEKLTPKNTGQGVPIEQSGAANIKSPDSKAKNNANQNSEPPQTTNVIPDKSLTIDNFSQSDGLVRVSASVSSPDPGNCYFGFASEGTKPVARSNPSVSDGSLPQKCSVDINEVEFTKLGSWKLTVIFSQNDAKLEKSQDVTIN